MTTRTAFFLCLTLPLGCGPALDEDGFTLDVEQAVATRAHDLGCFRSTSEPAYTLRLALTGEGDEVERTAVVIQEGPENFVRGTWSYVADGEQRRLVVDVPDADLTFEADDLEMKYGVLARFPAGDAECRIRGFFAEQPLAALGTFRCPDSFFDRVDYAFGADGTVVVEEERDDDGQITAQTDFGAYYTEGDDLFVLRPERTEPAKRFQRGSVGSGEVTLPGGACPAVAE